MSDQVCILITALLPDTVYVVCDLQFSTFKQKQFCMVVVFILSIYPFMLSCSIYLGKYQTSCIASQCLTV